jgi:hypothetical protein
LPADLCRITALTAEEIEGVAEGISMLLNVFASDSSRIRYAESTKKRSERHWIVEGKHMPAFVKGSTARIAGIR